MNCGYNGQIWIGHKVKTERLVTCTVVSFIRAVSALVNSVAQFLQWDAVSVPTRKLIGWAGNTCRGRRWLTQCYKLVKKKNKCHMIFTQIDQLESVHTERPWKQKPQLSVIFDASQYDVSFAQCKWALYNATVAQNYLHISECDLCIINSVLEGSIGRKICRAVRWRPGIFHGNHTICQLWVNTRIPSKKFAPSYSIKQASFDALRIAHNDIWDFRKFDLCVTNVAYLFALLMTLRADLLFSTYWWRILQQVTRRIHLHSPGTYHTRTTFVRIARRTNSGKHSSHPVQAWWLVSSL